MLRRFSLLSLLLCLLVPSPSPAAVGTIVLDRSEVEATLGRKLTWRERLSFSVAKRKAHRAVVEQDDTPQTNGMALAGFICGFAGLFFFGVILGPLAVVFSVIGLNKAKREGRPLRGLAIAGLILGIVSTVGAVIAIAALTQ